MSTSPTPTPENWKYSSLTNIPRLETDGSNWASYAMRFRMAMQATGKWDCFDGTKPRPIAKDPAAPTKDEKEAAAAWEKEDQVARYLLSQRLPDSTLLGLNSCTSATMCWNRVSDEYTAKSVYAQNDLEQAFLDMRCPKGGDVRPFLTTVRNKREELAAAGIRITNKEYQHTVLKSIPEELAKFAAQLLSSARLNHQPPVDTDTLIDHICEEAERLKNRRGGGAQSQKGGAAKKEGVDEALAATGSTDRKGRKKGKCHNCDKPGHWAKECRGPKRERSATDESAQAPQSTPKPKAENKPVGSANAVTGYDSEGDGFWTVVEPEDQAQFVGADPNPLLQEGEDSEGDCTLPDVDAAARDDPTDWAFEEELGDWLSDEGETAAAIITAAEVDQGARVELYDTGATRHLSPFKSDFKTYSPLTPPVLLNAANQQRFQAIGSGSMAIQIPNGDTEYEVLLRGVLYAPSVAYTLVSLGTLDAEGYHMTVGDGMLAIFDPYGHRVGQIERTSRGLYRVTHEEEANAAELLSVMELHRRMGHIAPSTARKLVVSGAVIGVELDPASKETHCDACLYARATRQPIPSVRIRPPAENFGDEIHTDVWGPARTPTRQGRHYFATFTDDATRYTVCFLLRTKDEAFESYKSFESWARTQEHCTGIKVLRSDRGGEYLSSAFNAHLAAAGTARKLTTHDMPQLNGIAERLNRTLLERIRAFAHESGLPKSLWGEALRHASWLKNRTATRALDGKTPFEALYGQPPDLQSLRIWGCPVWVHSPGGSKLDPRAKEARWLGVDVDARAHRIYWPGSGKVSVERDVYFGSSAQLEGEESSLDVPSEGIDQPDNPSAPLPTETLTPAPDSAKTSQPVVLRRSARNRKPSRPVRDLLSGEGTTDPDTARTLQLPSAFTEHPEEAGGVWSVEDGTPTLLEDFEGLEHAFAVETADAEALEPRTLAEAKRRPEWPLWEKAIEEELATLKAAGTWRLEAAPPGANVIGSKWVFKAKKDAAGNVVRYKARLVAQGFSQIGGVDYDDTYAPVAKLASSRAIIAMANRLRLELHQVDIKGAYLNGVLNENEVLYMQHPPGYKAVDAGVRVLRLVKTLYGLKQSGRRWYQKLTSIFDTLGFKQCQVDQAVFFKSDKKAGDITVVAVHVDDCTIAASSARLVDALKDGMRQHVEVTDLGELHWMLGIEVQRDRKAGTVHLSQRAYIDSILRRYHLDDLKPLSTPMDTQIRLSSEQAPKSAAEFAAMRDVPYREAVGALNWAALSTRPDIAFAVSTVARFASEPGPAHWEAVKRIFRYLAGTRELWLSYGETRRTLEGYADADGSMAEDRRAITGYAFLIDGSAISWSSKRQEIVSLSTTESEYVAATHGMKEALWLRSLLSEVFRGFRDATTLFSDNQAAIALARDHQYHARTKHIDVRYHWIRWVIEQGSLRLVYCPTDDMVADALTKALPSAKVKHFAAGLGLRAK
jgi:transposase InsO family protein